MPRGIPATAEGRERQLKRWQHNGHFGRVRMARANMHSIYSSTTTTGAAKRTAYQIERLLEQLHVELQERIDA